MSWMLKADGPEPATRYLLTTGLVASGRLIICLAIIGATIARLRRPDRREKTLDLLLQALGLLCEFAGRTENQFFNWLSFKRPPGGGALARPAET